MKIKASSNINNVATEMKDNIDIVKQMIDYLEFAISETLPNAWIGDDATSFAKKYNESITGNNCRDTNSNPRIKFSNISGSISGTKATIKVTLDIYSTNWEMLATSSNNNNARNICIVSSNKFSSGKCISNSVEIKSKSGKWNSNQHVLSGKTVTLTVNNVDDYNNLAFRVYSPGKGVNANPTCTHSSGYNCKTSTGSPFIFQSDYFFKVNK